MIPAIFFGDPGMTPDLHEVEVAVPFINFPFRPGRGRYYGPDDALPNPFEPPEFGSITFRCLDLSSVPLVYAPVGWTFEQIRDAMNAYARSMMSGTPSLVRHPLHDQSCNHCGHLRGEHEGGSFIDGTPGRCGMPSCVCARYQAPVGRGH